MAFGGAKPTIIEKGAAMSEHRIKLNWERATPDFEYKNYNRSHSVMFKNGDPVAMSASLAYKGDASMVDPEEAFVAALSSCHMLSFLAIASNKKYTVDAYEDQAVGRLEKNVEGQLAVTRVELRPRVKFSGDGPDAQTHRQMHDKAHHACFIANSVKTEVTVEIEEPSEVA
jgi:organic hydroperoxide reductase OsmC/OhrA